MSQTTSIEWTEATLNPWTGCTKVSPGCARCYIPRTMPFRTAGRKFVGGHIPLVFHMDRLEKMVRRRKPTLYFVNSLSDLFHEDASDEQIERVFAAMALAPQHTFQVLTKRPERMAKLLRNPGVHINILSARWAVAGIAAEPGVRARFIADNPAHPLAQTCPWPLPNVWLGVSIENRRFVHRADVLRATPAAVRFISAEPLLGPLIGIGWPGRDHAWMDDYLGDGLDLDGIDWLIVGGESGAGHRPLDLGWVRDLRDQCAAAATFDGERHQHTAFFVKQLGGARPGTKLEDLPEDLRIREFPRQQEVTHA